MQVRWTRQAGDSLVAILEFCEQCSVRRRQAVQTIIFQKVELLEDFPDMGAREPYLATLRPALNYRYILAGLYKIIYRLEGDVVWICHVQDARQDPGRLAGISPI